MPARFAGADLVGAPPMPGVERAAAAFADELAIELDRLRNELAVERKRRRSLEAELRKLRKSPAKPARARTTKPKPTEACKARKRHRNVAQGEPLEGDEAEDSNEAGRKPAKAERDPSKAPS